MVLNAEWLLKLRLLSCMILLCNWCVCLLTACVCCINFVVFTEGTSFFWKINTSLRRITSSPVGIVQRGVAAESATFLSDPGLKEVWKHRSAGLRQPQTRLTFSLHAHRPMARNATPRNCQTKKRETDEWVIWLQGQASESILENALGTFGKINSLC